MCLRIEYELVLSIIVDLILRVWGLDQVCVFQHLCQEETVLQVIKTSSRRGINVDEFRISTSCSACVVDSLEAVP